MHYKRRYPSKDKRGGYWSPKEDRDKTPHSQPSKAWRKLFDCKKLKGKHQFVEVRKEGSSIFKTWWWIVSKCIGCGKIKYLHIERAEDLSKL